MSEPNFLINREEFSQRYLRSLLIEPLERRLQSLDDFALSLPAYASVEAPTGSHEKSGASGQPGDRARFVRSGNSWAYRDHVLLEWQKHGECVHARVSEQDLQYTVTVSEQPDMAGAGRLTVDLHGALMRYERDAVTQRAGAHSMSDLGKGWARATLQWSLRLQLIATADGRAHLVSQPRRMVPVTDSGRVGAYIVSDPLTHLLNMPRLTHGWEHGAASLGAVHDQLVSRLAAAIEPTLAHHAYV